MSLDTLLDDVLGKSYLDPNAFRARAKAFGCNRALEGLDATNLLAMLASASRAVDTFTARESGSFSGGVIRENHTWNGDTRRIIINQPPLLTLEGFSIRTSPGTLSSFPVTPIKTDGDNNVAFGSFYYNRNENYIELNSLALAGSLTSTLVSLGMLETVVEVAYTSYATVPPQIAAAVGFTAAQMVNEYFTSEMAPGMSKVKTDNEEFTKDVITKFGDRFILPPQAARFLYGLSRISIG